MDTSHRHVWSSAEKVVFAGLTLLLLVCFGAAPPASAEETWQAGVARVDITPTEANDQNQSQSGENHLLCCTPSRLECSR